MQRTTFSGTRLRAQRVQAPKASRVAVVRVMDASALIVNTKGGGHAFIGLWLAKSLLDKGHSVTIMNDGDKAKLASKDPFRMYDELEGRGAKISWGKPTDPTTYPKASFDIVYDNNGKSIEDCKPLIDTFGQRVKHYVFVSSAGMYKPSKIEPAGFEDDERNQKDHYFVEEYLKEKRVPYTIFRPLYIYGPYTAKEYEQWFMDRILRDRPVPIPKPGVQLTSLTHVEDVAEMLALVPGNKNAIYQAFNVCSDRAITFNGLVKAIGAAAGKEPKIVHYDPEKVGLKKGEGFPFRTGHFFADPTKAKLLLGWQPKHNFLGDVKQRLEEYHLTNRLNAAPDFSTDDKILAALGK